MNFTPDQFLAAQRSMMETAQQVSTKMAEGAAQVFALNQEATRAAFAKASGQTMSVVQASGVNVGQAASAGSADAVSQGIMEYARRLYEIMARTNQEIMALIQKRAVLQAPEAAAEMASAAIRNAPTGAEAFFSAMQNPMNAAQNALQQALGGTAGTGTGSRHAASRRSTSAA